MKRSVAHSRKGSEHFAGEAHSEGRGSKIANRKQPSPGARLTSKIAQVLPNPPTDFSINNEVIQRSASFKFKEQAQANFLGRTYCKKRPIQHPNKNDKLLQQKQNTLPTHKTAAHWLNQYEGHSKRKQLRFRSKDYCNPKGNLKQEKNELPVINYKEETKFAPKPIAEKTDKYIRYILERKVGLEVRHSSNTRATKQKTKEKHTSLATTKRNEAFDGDAHTMNIGGITFAIHGRASHSDAESVQQLREHPGKEMNLMLYDFNGAKQRMVSGSPSPRDTYQKKDKNFYKGKTAEKFFQGKKQADGKVKSVAFVHDLTVANSLRQSAVEDEFPYASKYDQKPLANGSTKTRKGVRGEAAAVPILFANNIRQKLKNLIIQQKDPIKDDALKFNSKMLNLKSQIQDDISEMSYEESQDSTEKQCS